MTKTLIVPAGPHSIEVHLTSETHNGDALSVIEGDFRVGVPRRLEVSLVPESPALTFAWSD